MQNNLLYPMKMCSKYALIGLIVQCIFYASGFAEGFAEGFCRRWKAPDNKQRGVRTALSGKNCFRPGQ